METNANANFNIRSCDMLSSLRGIWLCKLLQYADNNYYNYNYSSRTQSKLLNFYTIFSRCYLTLNRFKEKQTRSLISFFGHLSLILNFFWLWTRVALWNSLCWLLLLWLLLLLLLLHLLLLLWLLLLLLWPFDYSSVRSCFRLAC